MAGLRPVPAMLRLCVSAGEAARVLPRAPGVAVFEDDQGRSVLVASGGDLRALAGERLSGDAGGRRADLSSVVARVRASTVGGAFEADIVTLELARERAPAIYAALTDRWQAWCLRLDAGAPTPIWEKADAARTNADAGVLLGPMPDKDSAGRLGERLDDLFELCRYPRELRLAPRGTACAYKEMGRCPGACDGSETMSAYRERVRAAVAFAGGRRDDAIERAQLAMQDAARGQDFERAAMLKERVERLEAGLRDRGFGAVGSMERFAAALVLPGERRGWARVMLLERGVWGWVADVDASAQIPGPAGLLPARPGAWPAGDAPAGERLGLLVSRWLVRPRRGVRRRSSVLDLRAGLPDARAWRRAIRAAAEPAGEDDEAVRAHEVG